MTRTIPRSAGPSRGQKLLLGALAASALVVGLAATPAFADHRRHGHWDRHYHPGWVRHYDDDDDYYYYAPPPPPVYYAPPPVYYAPPPPPVYFAPPLLNVVIPIR